MLDQEFSGFVTANRLQLYLERGGSGETVLYISGTGGDLRNKPNQFDSPLARYFNLVCYDQRGLGQSDKPDGEYTMADYADDAAAVLDLIGEESIRVVGVSFGGMVAQELALRYPQAYSLTAVVMYVIGWRRAAVLSAARARGPNANRACASASANI
jgi:pimeloyl-ACP methyl ester carboxylesterase